jgi:hypothetical protein
VSVASAANLDIMNFGPFNSLWDEGPQRCISDGLTPILEFFVAVNLLQISVMPTGEYVNCSRSREISFKSARLAVLPTLETKCQKGR